MFSASADAVLSSSFRYPDRYFLWARMRLFEDRIEFVGLGWTGMDRRTLSLDRLKDLRWWTGDGNINFGLLLHDGERVYVRVKAAGLWKHEVESRAPNLDSTEATLPDHVPSARARAA